MRKFQYAADTSVSVEKSRAELEAILTRYGATAFGYMADQRQAVIMFKVKNRGVKFLLPLPDRGDRKFRFTPHRHHARSEREAIAAWEQACRSYWRALLLCVKAKLEAVQCGITTFDQEFLAHFVLPNGQTFGEVAGKSLDHIVSTGEFPLMLQAPPTVSPEKVPTIVDVH